MPPKSDKNVTLNSAVHTRLEERAGRVRLPIPKRAVPLSSPAGQQLSAMNMPEARLTNRMVK